MSRVDRINRCLELKLVIWGPARSGKTTALRSLHGACDTRRRGQFACIAAERGREAGETGGFDFVPLELPRFRDFDLRADCFSVPGFVGYEATRRRLLRGADGVLFVADASAANADANAESWQALDRLLRTIEAHDTVPVPVVALANKTDASGSRNAEWLEAQLDMACGRRPLTGVVETCARQGEGIVAAFRQLVTAAAARALEPLESLHLTDGGLGDAPPPADATRDRAFVDALGSQFGSPNDGAVVDETPPRPTLAVALERTLPARETEPRAPEAPATERSPWQGTQELELRERRRDAALGRLLVDVAHACAAATDAEGAARSVLIQLVMNLDAITGWVGLADEHEDEIVFDPMGRAVDAMPVAEAAQALGLGLVDDGTVPVGEAATSGFPGGAAGGRGIFLQFPVSGGAAGWLLLVGPPGRGLPADAEPTLHTAAAILGLTVARLHALDQLRSLNRALEQKVAERTSELRCEKATLEQRVRERTHQLERAKRAALATERQLFDRGRQEGVRHVAAGLAHELNNPLSAVAVNLKFALEMLDDMAPGAAIAADWLDDVGEAVRDAAAEAELVAARVSSIALRDVSASRRAAACTNLHAAVTEAVTHFQQVFPTAPAPRISGPTDLNTSIQPAELTRWLFRLLSGLTAQADCEAQIDLAHGDDGPRADIRLDGSAATGATETLAAIGREIQHCGGHLDADLGLQRCRIGIALPAPMGARGTDALWGRTA